MSFRNTSPHPNRYQLVVVFDDGKTREYRFGAHEKARQTAAKLKKPGPLGLRNAARITIHDTLYNGSPVTMQWERQQ